MLEEAVEEVTAQVSIAVDSCRFSFQVQLCASITTALSNHDVPVNRAGAADDPVLGATAAVWLLAIAGKVLLSILKMPSRMHSAQYLM